MFTCGNNALVVGDGTAIVKFGFPTDNVKFNAVYTYECYAAGIFAIQIDGIALNSSEKQTRKENKSLVHVQKNYNNKELTLTLCRSTV
jgi:hypothetical protein